jgi:hypothetical protein
MGESSRLSPCLGLEAYGEGARACSARAAVIVSGIGPDFNCHLAIAFGMQARVSDERHDATMRRSQGQSSENDANSRAFLRKSAVMILEPFKSGPITADIRHLELA